MSIVPGEGPNQQYDFYAALGWSISQWQSVELWVGVIFSKVAGNSSFESKVAFNAAVNFSTKLSITNAAMAAAYDRVKYKEVHNKWVKLATKIRKKSLDRNDLVHFTVVLTSVSDPESNEHSILLEPNHIAQMTKYRDKKKSYNVNDVIAKGAAFSRLAGQLMDFSVEIGAVTKRK